LCNQKVHYLNHKSPPPIVLLSHIEPVHVTTSYLRSILILSTHLRFGLPSGLFPSGFLIDILHAFSFAPLVLHALPISSSLILSFWLYLEKSTSYEAPHYAVFSNLLSLLRLDWWSNIMHSLIECVTTLYSSLLDTHTHTHTHTLVFTVISSLAVAW
jgi:hypothetical protein